MTVSEAYVKYIETIESILNKAAEPSFRLTNRLTPAEEDLLFSFLNIAKKDFITHTKTEQLAELDVAVRKNGFKYHPDRCKKKEDKEKAEKLFKAFGNCTMLLINLVNSNVIPSMVASTTSSTNPSASTYDPNEYETPLEQEYRNLYTRLKNNGPSTDLRHDFQILSKTCTSEAWKQLDHSSLQTLLCNVLGIPFATRARVVVNASNPYSRSNISSTFGIKRSKNFGVILEELEAIYDSYHCLGLTDLFFRNLERIFQLKLEEAIPQGSQTSTSQELSAGNQRIFNRLQLYNVITKFLFREFILTIEAKRIDFLSWEYPIESLIELAIATNPNYLHSISPVFYEKINKLLERNDERSEYYLLKCYSCIRLATQRIDRTLESSILFNKITILVSKNFICRSYCDQKPKDDHELKLLVDKVLKYLNDSPINDDKQIMLQAIKEDKFLLFYFIDMNSTPNSDQSKHEKLFAVAPCLKHNQVLKLLEHQSVIKLIQHLTDSPFYAFQRATWGMPLEEMQFLHKLMTAAASVSCQYMGGSTTSINGLEYDLSHLKKVVVNHEWEDMFERLGKDIQQASKSANSVHYSAPNFAGSRGESSASSEKKPSPFLPYQK